ncbi:UNVERIFIED_CONTAM: hypothetical protein K2H54_059179 [Gekko kuhli]
MKSTLPMPTSLSFLPLYRERVSELSACNRFPMADRDTLPLSMSRVLRGQGCEAPCGRSGEGVPRLPGSLLPTPARPRSTLCLLRRLCRSRGRAPALPATLRQVRAARAARQLAMAMASPAVGQFPYALLLDKEQQLFLQSLSANERKKILKRSASSDMKPQQPRRRPPPLHDLQQPHAAPGGAVPQAGTEQPPAGKAPLPRPAAAAACGRHRGSLAEPLPPLLGAPSLAREEDEDEAAIVALCREPPASPGPAAKPPRPGLLHQRLRLRSAAPRLLPDVRTIFEQPRDPRVREEKGEGHRFEAFAALWPGWCDLCGEAVRQRALRCASFLLLAGWKQTVICAQAIL